MNTETVKGFDDYIGEEAEKRREIKRIIEETFRVYGFSPAETPVIEYEEFVKGDNAQDEAISDIFRLEDKGKRKLALRYEFTFQLKRLIKNQKLPFKRYQIGGVFRDEPVSANRFRQITQCDADTIGSDLKDEAELLTMTNDILNKLGIKSIICFNNRKLLNEILDKENIKNKGAVLREIDKLDKLPEKEILENLKKYKAEKILNVIRNKESFFEKYDTYSEIKELKRLCKNYGIKIEFQPYLARGLSYYNGTVFEIKTKEMKETICGGGSYSVNGINSTGISFGVERLSKLAKIIPAVKKILIISINEDKKAINLAQELRKNDVSCMIQFGKISKALDYANSLKIPYAVFIGKEEVGKGKIKIRDMKSGKEQLLTVAQLIKKLKI